MSANKVLCALALHLITMISVIAQRQGDERPICVPRGTCIRNKDERGIDVRVMVPDEIGKCTNGRELCYQTHNATRCGYTYTHLSTQDGPAPDGAHPWLAYIVNQTGYTGAGVLLDRYHVLTAAHKVYRNKNSLQKLDVYIGVHDRSSLSTDYKRAVEDMIIHPNFDRVSLKNDLAVLRLKAQIPLGYQKNVGTACLPRQNAKFNNKECMMAGWGDSNFGASNAPTSHQKQVTVPIVSYEKCRNSMRHILGENTDNYLDKDWEICAGGETGRDACTNDGGAPLICRDSSGKKVIAGLVIWGMQCGRPNLYGVYVNIPKYVDWINRAIQNLRA